MSMQTVISATAALALTASASWAETTPVSFGANWVAQAEHGGFYQAVADGTYEACGLDVTIVPGGPQINNRALMLAGKIDFFMGGDLLNLFNARAQDVPVVAVAAAFQKHPQVFVAHPGTAESFGDLKDLTLLVADGTYQSIYQWMIAEHGFKAENRKPYTFSPAPFLADTGVAMQGFLTSEPYLVEKTGGFEPKVFLVADAGYSTYATTVEAMAETVETRPEVVQCFVDGTAIGWYNYLYGDNAAANAAIKQANPEMTDDKIAYAISKLIENGIVDSGDTLELGIGALTEEKVGTFYEKMLEVGVIETPIDWQAAINTSFANKGVGLDLRPN